MKRLVCLASAAMVMVVFVGAGAEDPPSIKTVMDKLHKGANSPLAKLKTALKAESPDWKQVQDLAKEFATYGPALAKNDPPAGDKANFDKLATAYADQATALESAAKEENKAKAKAALGKIGASCKACHTAHKGK
jgi:cytochrome c556